MATGQALAANHESVAANLSGTGIPPARKRRVDPAAIECQIVNIDQ
jgi:hypothetical protein